MLRQLALVPLALAALLSTPDPAAAWGPTGHRVVGAIAQEHLTPAARQGVEQLLGRDSLAEVSTWADFIRSDPDWRRADDWHWVTLPEGVSYDESEKNPRGDVLEALQRFEATLRDPQAPLQDRQEALKFLVHMVGDLHQPLHVGTGDDRGGNQVLVTWFGEPSNLHTVWDSEIIDSEELSFTEWVAFLDVSADERAAWQQGSYLDWAEESRALRGVVYDLGDRRLSWDYRFRALPVIEQRLRQGGVRLAHVLNRIYAAP